MRSWLAAQATLRKNTRQALFKAGLKTHEIQSSDRGGTVAVLVASDYVNSKPPPVVPRSFIAGAIAATGAEPDGLQIPEPKILKLKKVRTVRSRLTHHVA